MTLVICEGTPAVRTLWAALDIATFAEAKRALAIREGVSDDNIKHSIGYHPPSVRG